MVLQIGIKHGRGAINTPPRHQRLSRTRANATASAAAAPPSSQSNVPACEGASRKRLTNARKARASLSSETVEKEQTHQRRSQPAQTFQPRAGFTIGLCLGTRALAHANGCKKKKKKEKERRGGAVPHLKWLHHQQRRERSRIPAPPPRTNRSTP